jgi:hypothetical protein
MRALVRPPVLFSLVLLALAGCAGGREAAPQDPVLNQAMDSGRQSVVLERLSVAESQYRQAGRRALARDDAPAIGDAGYNLAVVLLAQDRPAEVLATVAATRDALAVRGRTDDDAALDLVQATALYRLSRDAEAEPLAADAMGSPEPAIDEQAALLTGLIADARGDRATLATAIGRMAHAGPIPPKWEADEDELRARLLVATDPAEARDLARRAADLRRGILEYRGMVRALLLAARAAARAGDAGGASALSIQARQSLGAQTTPASAEAPVGPPDPFAAPS